jgi:hypothetical protein
MAAHRFKLWLEFEVWEPKADDDPEDDFFNMQITLDDEKKYALNVWTFKYLLRAVQDCRESGECLHGSYLTPPDLFVQRLDRGLLEQVVAELIADDELKEEWRVPDEQHSE